ncbi:hypothetical protein RBB84_18730 [Rhodococcus sp. D-6]|uniref:Uncharacterized protein n=1 Tax=Rhodococcus sp. D-6 TaxID=1387842 RepID=A0AAU7UTP8_9NOCA
MESDFNRLSEALFQPYVDGWSQARRDRIQLALVDGGPVLETDVTELLMAMSGDLEQYFLTIVWDTVGLGDPPKRAFVVDSRFFVSRFPSPSGCKHVPDMCVVRTDETGEPLELLVVIEAKGNAQVNGDRGYCKARGSTYSNQAIAYPAGCWTSANVDKAKMLWIGPDYAIGHERGPWGTKGLIPSDVTRYDLGTAFAEQEAARERWIGLGWGELSDKLRSHPDGGLVARVLDTWSRHFV